MAAFTKQQLKDAYFAAIVENPSAVVKDNAWFASEVVRVQASIDAQLASLTAQKDGYISRAARKAAKIQIQIDEVQAQIDSIEVDAKESMKDVALNYIWSQENAQDELDTGEVGF